MKRTSRIRVTSRPTLLGAVVMLALTSASVAAADDGPGPFGVTADAVATRHTARVGALFGADRADDLVEAVTSARRRSCTARRATSSSPRRTA